MDSSASNTAHVEWRLNRAGQPRAYIVGTRIRVQDIVCDHERHGMSPDEIVSQIPHLSLGQVYGALAFYHDHRDEIRTHLREDEEFARQMEAAERAKRSSLTAEQAANASTVSP